jgi:pyridoxamine 5'-phosphate oxidase family protein
MIFSEAELRYLSGQRVGRLATIGPDGAPQTRPVGFAINQDTGTVDIGGLANFTSTRKYRNIRSRPQVSFVVDDLASVDPPRGRGLEVRGVASAVDEAQLIRIRPSRILTWGLDGDSFTVHGRSVTASADS